MPATERLARPNVLVLDPSRTDYLHLLRYLKYSARKAPDVSAACDILGDRQNKQPDVLIFAADRFDKGARAQLDAANRSTAILIATREHTGTETDEVIHKPFSRDDLQAKILKLTERAWYIRSAANPTPGRLGLLPEDSIIEFKGRRVHVTPTERAILKVLQRSPGQMIDNEAIRDIVWGGKAIADSSLNVYLRGLRRKLNTLAPGESGYLFL